MRRDVGLIPLIGRTLIKTVAAAWRPDKTALCAPGSSSPGTSSDNFNKAPNHELYILH